MARLYIFPGASVFIGMSKCALEIPSLSPYNHIVLFIQGRKLSFFYLNLSFVSLLIKFLRYFPN